ncbi:MDIS1-interacting receptor like kinase 2-like protein [Tanacetum coccineum]
MLNLDHLDLRTNKLNGSIPQELSNLQKLKVLNLGHNDLGGHIPSSFVLKSVSESFHNCPHSDPEINPPFGYYSSDHCCFLLLGYVCYHRHMATKDKIELQTIKHGDVRSILNYDGTIAYEDFISATEDFDLKYCIGTGGYGSVYEATLPSGKKLL